jgi:hypothetical protein
MLDIRALTEMILRKVTTLVDERLRAYQPKLTQAVGTLPARSATPPAQMPGGGYTPLPATASVLGGVQLAGALTGTADAPAIADGAVGLDQLAFDPATQAELTAHAADVDASAAALHHTLGAGAHQAAAGNHNHQLSSLGDVPAGGATGQALRKTLSGFEWYTPGAGGSGLTLEGPGGDPVIATATALRFEAGTLIEESGVAVYTPPAGGSGGAPTDSLYVLGAADSDLPDAVVISDLQSDPDRLPASPQAEDDEFNLATLDSKWMRSGTYATSNVHATWKSFLYALLQGDQTLNLEQSYTPAAVFSVTAKIRYPLAVSNQVFVLRLADATADEAMQLNWYAAAGSSGTILPSVQLGSRDSGAYTTRQSSVVPWTSSCYVHVQRAAGNVWSAWWSFDGYSWIQAGNGTHTKSFTPTTLGIFFNQQGAAATARVGIGWVRRDWLTL